MGRKIKDLIRLLIKKVCISPAATKSMKEILILDYPLEVEWGKVLIGGDFSG
jgi:hypothetical protein